MILRTLSFAAATAAMCVTLSGCLEAERRGGHVSSAVGVSPNGSSALPPVASDAPIVGATPPEVVPPGSTPTPLERIACTDARYQDAYTVGYTPDPAVRAEVAAVTQSMTIEQKIVQLTGVASPNYMDGTRWDDIQRSYDDEALGIRGYMWRDGPHGVNLEALQHDRPSQGNYSTAFPTSVAQGASFDLDLLLRVGEAMGDETVASKNTVLLAPCMNVLRHPYWGRAQETFGEDSFHLGRVASAVTVGIQQHVVGCAKHWAANNIEVNRFNLNAEMDEQTLREIYGRHFEMVVRDGGIGCVMASYNSVNGKKQTQNYHTITEVLRGDFGYQGFVLTDWWAMPGADNGQGPVDPPDDRLNAAEAIQAGLDVEVPWALNYDALKQVVDEGTVPVALVDAAVNRVLEQKKRFNAYDLDGPIGLKTPRTQLSGGSITGNDDHIALAQELAEKSMVLLENENQTLPIAIGSGTVAVIGATVNYTVPSDDPPNKTIDWVRDQPLGDRGSSRVLPDPAKTTGPLAGIQAAAPSGVTVIGGSTAAEAADADFVVVMVGLTAGDEGEEYTGAGDRESLALPPPHDALVQDVAALGKPMVVVIQAGAVVSLPWLNSVPAVVMAWYPGQKGGAALGRLLFGQTNFAGRLPVTWPTDESQLPVFNESTTTVMDYFLGYRRFDQLGLTPLFAFGHGLSYSTFGYSNLQVPCQSVSKNGVIELKVDVTNEGTLAGDEVVQVYASFPETQAARRSLKELKGFARVNVLPGETKRVTIPVRVSDLKYWDMSANSWVVESGPVLFRVGPSSDRLLLEETVLVD